MVSSLLRHNVRI